MNAAQAPQLTCWTASLRHKGKVAVTELRWCWLAVCAFPHFLCHLRPESSDPGSLLQPPTVPVSPSAPSTQLPSCQGGELPKANLILLPRLTASLLVASLGTCCLPPEVGQSCLQAGANTFLWPCLTCLPCTNPKFHLARLNFSCSLNRLDAPYILEWSLDHSLGKLLQIFKTCCKCYHYYHYCELRTEVASRPHIDQAHTPLR